MTDMLTLSRFFNALGDETRLRLVTLLSRQEPGNAFCVGRLAREMDTTASNVSQHLRVLKDLGLVYSERRGYNIHYFLNPEQLAAYQHLIYELLGEQFFPTPNIVQKEIQPMSETRSDCVHPGLRPADGECSPEQIRECHGEAQEHPCDCKSGSDCQGEAKQNPLDCTPEQIRICHGEEDVHPCEKHR
ncbi:MAG: helix-turn-helix transcriptional regulator [Anaerolineales bacterium]|nr:helix-turn-helix transcriptional regulator [Anaerolineales bacterium]